MKIALTGSTGNMGCGVLDALEGCSEIDGLKILVRSKHKEKFLLKKYRYLKNIATFVLGKMSDKVACEKLVADVDYVVNMGAVIPPQSDSFPRATIDTNEKGVRVLVEAIEALPCQPKFIHISTVALYGNRAGRHKWGRVGEPLLPSPFDIYSATKLRGEFCVLESRIKKFVVLRQTAMLHKKMLSSNVNDGLMFHTCFDAPLEWLTAHDSGVLIKNLILLDDTGKLENDFWKKCYNMGGGSSARVYGWQTLDEGFAMIGGSIKDFFEPHYNALRNFHGMWFLDSDVLENKLHFRSQSHKDYWQEILKMNPYYKMGRIVPKKLLKFFVIQRLLCDKNAPSFWAKQGDVPRVTAYFGSTENYKTLCQTSWENFELPENVPAPESDFDFGFDFAKQDGEIDISDLQNVAAMHGGKLLSLSYSGDVYEKLDWQTQDGEKFSACVYTVLRAGHWHNALYNQNVWDFDRLAKRDKIFAQIWYDSHDESEARKYFFDEKFVARME